MKIGILDDHRLFRKSLVMLVSSFDEAEVAVEAEKGSEFLQMAALSHLDVAILDIQMPEMSGYEVCQKLLSISPDTKILMVSQLSTRETLRQVMDCGAHGFITKNSDPEVLALALRNLSDKGFYLGPELGSVLKEAYELEQALPNVADAENVFTPREKEIICLAAKEKSTAEIAAELFVHTRTVESHRNNMISKIGAKNFIGVILFALRHRIISFDDIK